MNTPPSIELDFRDVHPNRAIRPRASACNHRKAAALWVLNRDFVRSAKRQMELVFEVTCFQLRAQRRNPVWMVSLALAGLLGFSEAFTFVPDWPTVTQSSRGFQLGCVTIFNLMSFLLCAGALARDLSKQHRDLFFSRPIPSWVYIAGTYLGNVLFALAICLTLMAAFLALPLFRGQACLYPIGPFFDILVYAAIPGILFSGALAVLLMCLSRRVIIALPLFLVYFMAVALFRIPVALQANMPEVDLWDFSMRMYPRSVSVHLGASTLHDMSYGHLLNPPSPELLFRVGLYSTLALFLVGLSILILKRLRTH